MEALKILLNVALLFIVVVANNIDPRDCSRISHHLPINIVEPINYKIDLVVKPPNRYISGTSEITIDVKKTTKNISLNSYGMEIEFNNINIMKIPETYGKPGEVVYELRMFGECSQAQIWVMIFDDFIKPGKYILNIEYKSILYINKRIKPKSYLWDPSYQAFTNHYTPKAIREIFPCWDDPAVKTTFNISITHFRTYKAFLITPLAENTGSNMQTSRFKEINRIPTHLLSITVIDRMVYCDMTTRLHTVYHRYDHIHQILLKKMWEMLGAAAREYNILMHSFKEEIKVDHVLLSNAVMEVMARPGVIIYREEDLFYNETYHYAGRETYMLTLLSHQVGRQWFLGAEVHDDWLLREAISLFYGYLISSQVKRDQLLMDLFVVKHLQPALNNEEHLGMIQVIDKFDILDEIDGLFHSRLYYNKVASLIRLLHYILPEEDFNKGIVEYLKGGTNNFWTVMQSFNSIHLKKNNSLKTTMDTWLKEKYYPELYVFRNYYNNIATCYYSYHYHGNYTWKIPVTSIIQSNLIYYNVSIRNLTVNWLEDDTLIIYDIPRSDFIIFNVEQLGYYRVNYNHENWRRIYTFLNNNSFTLVPVLNRAQLINDAYYFKINSNNSESDVFFHLIKYLRRETDYLAWYPMLNIFLDMSAYMECLEGEFVKMKFMNILDGLLSNLGYEEKSYEDPTKTALRWLGMKWACKIGHNGCRDKATKNLIDYVQSREKYRQDHEMLLWLKDWVFCTGMMKVNMSFWNKIKNESIANTDSELLHYLHCTEDDLAISSLLTTDFRKNPRLNKKDVYRSIVKQHGKRYNVVVHILNNYVDIKTRFNLSDNELLGELIMNSYYYKNLDVIEKRIENLSRRFSRGFIAHSIEVLISARKKQLKKILDKFKYFKDK
ncbi:glutamyl aminopeptidase-like [Odontomachus brunneus]|uniref:glutamyl aminopeptidase-like n=1 Tax=Odontomachus brunneus TaxID=486640 RepID=UPI0013F27597|nr:glutamyl aminopeptidase-like [Odontomachus brunneus]